MAQQSSQTNATYPFILGGTALVAENETLLTDAARTVILYQYTVMAQVAASGKWVPWTSATATDGSAIPQGILMNDGGVTAAALAAADVTGAQILIGSCVEIDGGQLVFDLGSTGGGAALTLATVFTGNAVGSGTATPYILLTGRKLLAMAGIFAKTAYVASKTA